MKFVIVEASGTQYQVSEGDTITVDKLDKKENDTVTFDHVLMMVDGEAVTIGTPHIAGASVVGQVIGHKKGDKIRVAKFVAKSRTRRVKGYRSELTDIKITGIKKSKQSIANSK